jgi:hypothetical protein
MKDWHKLGAPGIIVLVLSVGLSTSMVLAILSTMLRTNPLGDAASVFLSTLFGTVVGAVATYLGQARSDDAKKPEAEEKTGI